MTFVLGIIGAFGSIYNITLRWGGNDLRFVVSLVALLVSVIFLLAPFVEWFLIYRALTQGVVVIARITHIDRRTKAYSSKRNIWIEGRLSYDYGQQKREEMFTSTSRWALRAKTGDHVRVLVYGKRRTMVKIPIDLDVNQVVRR
jgi:hypothetical protein